MRLNDVRRTTSVCISADVVASLTGHRGIGKTQLVGTICKDWKDPWMPEGTKGIPMFPLYCATQEVTDLIGFPIQVWESDSSPVVKGIAPPIEGDRIVTDWAIPAWASDIRKHCEQFEESDKETRAEMVKKGATEEQLWAFWNRPKALVFLDEVKRAPREVIQAMYPFMLERTLHMHHMPRGTRVVTADNFAGAYDVREPDEAFMGRLCHIEVDTHIAEWTEWAVENKVYPKIINFLTSYQEMLLQVPKDQEEATIHYQAIPDPRRWGDMVNRIEKYGRLGVRESAGELQENAIRQAIVGCVGMAVGSSYWKFADNVISIEDILTGKGVLKDALAKIPNEVKQNKLKEKLQIEAGPSLKKRKYNAKEAKRLRTFLKELDSKERATAILQAVFLMKNSNELSHEWIAELMADNTIMEIIEHLTDKKRV